MKVIIDREEIIAYTNHSNQIEIQSDDRINTDSDNIMFAKRWANVLNLGFFTFYLFLCVGQGKCY
jgi:hypothetical protein